MDLGDVISVAALRADGARGRRRKHIDLRQLRTEVPGRTVQDAASIVGAARAATLDALGDTAGAATIAARQLRTRTG